MEGEGKVWSVSTPPHTHARTHAHTHLPEPQHMVVGLLVSHIVSVPSPVVNVDL